MIKQTIKLGDLCEIISGGTPSRSVREYWNGSIHWVKISDMLQGEINITDERISKKGLENCSAKIIPKNTILLSIFATVGRVAVLNIDAATNQAIVGIKIKDENILHKKYLKYILKFNTNALKNKSRGVGQNNINISILKELLILLPSLEEQQRIATLLDTAENLLQKREQSIAKLDELMQSVFVDMFGDPFNKNAETIKLGEVATINMGQSPAGSTYNNDGVGVYLLNGPTEFGEKYPVPKQWTSSPTKMCNPGDLLFCVRGATAGRLNIADASYCIGRGLAAINSNNLELVNNEFSNTLLKSYYQHFQNTGTGSTFINISKDDLKNLSIPKVNKNELLNFQKFETKANNWKRNMGIQLQNCKNLLTSLQHQSFAVN